MTADQSDVIDRYLLAFALMFGLGLFDWAIVQLDHLI
jgi:hypothetical protein